MAKRVESPSSINTFKQCKRKYYHQYIEGLPSLPNIHQVRGNIAHSTLEHFYDIDVSQFTLDNYPLKFKEAVQSLLLFHWNSYKNKLDELNLNNDQKKFYFEETLLMIMNWVNQFIDNIKELMKKKSYSITEAFMHLTPIRELEYKSDHYSVHGFIDAIQYLDEEIHIIDYKTNSNFDMKGNIRLQLAIYTLLFFEKHGKMPDKVGIYFLRHKLKTINVDQELLELAKKEIELIHTHTSNSEQIDNYPRTVTGLCKWSTGQCDFYDVCKPHDRTNR